jgi:nucleotide-binding universal stress UspA family protein
LAARGVEASVEVWRGAPFSAISETARDGDLIVMASHGRVGFRRWLLGSVAEKLVRSGPVPVMIVPILSASRASEELRELASAVA